MFAFDGAQTQTLSAVYNFYSFLCQMLRNYDLEYKISKEIVAHVLGQVS